ncbi:MAG: hypothetical protein AAFO76_05875 [Cyanobacteria bacterium J06607_15]
MSISVECPCCRSILLHHVSNRREYWFCRHCWQEMPDLEVLKLKAQLPYKKGIVLPVPLVKGKVSV